MLFFCFTYSFRFFFNLLSLKKYSKKGIGNYLFLIGQKKHQSGSLIFKTEYYIHALKFTKWVFLYQLLMDYAVFYFWFYFQKLL